MSREQEIVAKLKEWSFHYYETGEVAVDDATFDEWESELRVINPNHPIFNEVGYGYAFKGVSEEEKFEHPIVVGTIPKEKDLQELIAWMGDDDCTASCKLDGNSISHYYVNGKYLRSLTRGQNNIGIDRSAKFIGKVPMSLPIKRNFQVKGEAVISKENYTVENGFDPEVSSRNAVAGILFRQSDWEDQMKLIDFVAFTFTDTDTKENLYNEINWDEYFSVEHQVKISVEDVANVAEFEQRFKLSSKYECDGSVIRKSSGAMKAFKFEEDKRLTLGIGFDVTIGINQQLTPVLLLEPVKMNGASMKRASLGSFDRAVSEGFWPLYENHVVEIIRTNDILPYATRVVSKGDYLLSNPVGIKYEVSENSVPKCPACGSDSEQIGKHYYCVNANCPNIEESKLLKFASFFYPMDFGASTFIKVCRHFNIVEVLDLYNLDIDELEASKIPGVGDSKKELAIQFFSNIRKPVNSKYVYQTFFRSCGKTLSRVILESGFKFNYIYNKPEEITNTLAGIKNFRKEIVRQMQRGTEFFRNFANIVEVFDEDVTETVGTFCITEARFSERQLKILADKGWKEDTSVKKTTSILVVANLDSVTGKVKKAMQYGIPVMELDSFVDKYLS